MSSSGIERASGTPISSLAALARSGQQARAAVAADVAKGAQRAVVVAQHEDRLAAGGRGQVAAGVRQARDVRRELPGALEDALELELGDVGIAIGAGGKGSGGVRRALDRGHAGILTL